MPRSHETKLVWPFSPFGGGGGHHTFELAALARCSACSAFILAPSCPTVPPRWAWWANSGETQLPPPAYAVAQFGYLCARHFEAVYMSP